MPHNPWKAAGSCTARPRFALPPSAWATPGIPLEYPEPEARDLLEPTPSAIPSTSVAPPPGPIQGLLEPFLQSVIGAICPDLRHSGQLPSQWAQQQLGPFFVMEVCWMHLGLDDQALGVHEQVALATLYFLAAVIASGSHFSVVLANWLSI